MSVHIMFKVLLNGMYLQYTTTDRELEGLKKEIQ